MTPGCTTLRNAVIHLALPLLAFAKVWVVPAVIYTTVAFRRRTEGLVCEPQASSSVLLFSHVETRQCDCAAFTEQLYSYNIYQLGKTPHYPRFVIHIDAHIRDPPADRFVDKPFILTTHF